MLEKKIEPKDKYLYTSKPEVQKIYTTQEIAEYLETTCSVIRNIVSYYHIPRSVVPTENSRAAFYSYDAVREIKEYFEAKKSKERQAIIRQKLLEKELTDEEAETLHPLVTDKRCLNLNWWPDVVPECFKELSA